MLLGVECSIAISRTVVAEHDVVMDVSIEILNAVTILCHGVLESSLGLSIVRVSAAAIVTFAMLQAVTVDIHVGQVPTLTLQIDNSLVLQMVCTIAIAYINLISRTFISGTSYLL